ncbi:MAG: hypothetical protein AAF988_05390 [Pseudomonadota bacterium]
MAKQGMTKAEIAFRPIKSQRLINLEVFFGSESLARVADKAITAFNVARNYDAVRAAKSRGYLGQTPFRQNFLRNVGTFSGIHCTN